jgi:hypothetical protein
VDAGGLEAVELAGQVEGVLLPLPSSPDTPLSRAYLAWSLAPPRLPYGV